MEITQQELKKKIENGDKIIIDFWGKHCGPCKVMKPAFDNVSKQLRDENSLVQLFTLDVQENRDIAIELGVRSIPTLKLFSEGKEIYSHIGIQTETQIKELVTSLLN